MPPSAIRFTAWGLEASVAEWPIVLANPGAGVMILNRQIFKAAFRKGLFGAFAMVCGMSVTAQLDANAATEAPGWMRMASWENPFNSPGYSRYDPYDTRPGRISRQRSPGQYRRSVATGSSRIPLMSEKTIRAMLAVMDRYEAIVRNGGWPSIPRGAGLRLNARSKRVALLRRRLLITGDLTQRAGISTVYDSYVFHAVKRFQKRHGLRQNGVVRKRTLAALNVSARRRLAQLQVNYRRLVSKAAKAPRNRYVMVNIPSSELEAVEGNSVSQRHRVVVGKPDRQTPVLNATIRELNFYPYWHVPVSIVRKDLIPKLLKDPGYLRRTNLRVYRNWGGTEVDARSIDWRSPGVANLKFRQDPGRNNALGVLRLNMPNKEAVYLHDTPMKSLFNRNVRAYSAGCVRVQNILSLASWLTQGNKGWNRLRIDQVVRSKESETVPLGKSVPVYFSYFTAWATPDGKAQFRRDLYSRDGAGIRAELERSPGNSTKQATSHL